MVGGCTMTPEEFRKKAKELVVQYENERTRQMFEKDSGKAQSKEQLWSQAKFKVEDVYIVWWAKTLENAKIILSQNRTKGMLYEVTLNGSKNEIYFNAYKKEQNISIPVTTEEDNND